MSSKGSNSLKELKELREAVLAEEKARSQAILDTLSPPPAARTQPSPPRSAPAAVPVPLVSPEPPAATVPLPEPVASPAFVEAPAPATATPITAAPAPPAAGLADTPTAAPPAAVPIPAAAPPSVTAAVPPSAAPPTAAPIPAAAALPRMAATPRSAPGPSAEAAQPIASPPPTSPPRAVSANPDSLPEELAPDVQPRAPSRPSGPAPAPTNDPAKNFGGETPPARFATPNPPRSRPSGPTPPGARPAPVKAADPFAAPTARSSPVTEDDLAAAPPSSLPRSADESASTNGAEESSAPAPQFRPLAATIPATEQEAEIAESAVGVLPPMTDDEGSASPRADDSPENSSLFSDEPSSQRNLTDLAPDQDPAMDAPPDAAIPSLDALERISRPVLDDSPPSDAGYFPPGADLAPPDMEPADAPPPEPLTFRTPLVAAMGESYAPAPTARGYPPGSEPRGASPHGSGPVLEIPLTPQLQASLQRNLEDSQWTAPELIGELVRKVLHEGYPEIRHLDQVLARPGAYRSIDRDPTAYTLKIVSGQGVFEIAAEPRGAEYERWLVSFQTSGVEGPEQAALRACLFCLQSYLESVEDFSFEGWSKNIDPDAFSVVPANSAP